jgi:hypothetical protein
MNMSIALCVKGTGKLALMMYTYSTLAYYYASSNRHSANSTNRNVTVWFRKNITDAVSA